MRVLVTGINYRPELIAIGPYTAALAEALVARGDEVAVIAGLPSYPAWRIARGTPRRLFRGEIRHGVRVLHAAHYVPARQSALRRAAYEGTFLLSGLAAAPMALAELGRPDAVLGIVPSLSGAALAWTIGRAVGVPYGILFQDMMGSAAAQSGMEGGGTVASVTAAAERHLARGAAAVGIVSPAFRAQLVGGGVAPGRIHEVPNWARLATPDLGRDEMRALLGWDDERTTVLHAGNMGLKQGLDQVVEAARLAAGRHLPLRFVMAGGGNQAERLRAAGAGIPNLAFLDIQPDRRHASLLAAADILLLSERASQLDMSLPSKLTSYMASGRPIVAAIPDGGATAGELARAAAALVVPAGEPEEILAAAMRLRTDPGLAAELGAAGQAYAAANLSATACVARAIRFVDALAAGDDTVA